MSKIEAVLGGILEHHTHDIRIPYKDQYTDKLRDEIIIVGVYQGINGLLCTTDSHMTKIPHDDICPYIPVLLLQLSLTTI